jgi:hypothetical protein
MGIDLGTFLSAYATVIDGDPLALSWSIGGAKPGISLGNLLSTPQGLSGSHNKVSRHVRTLRFEMCTYACSPLSQYESDASPGRGDAALNNGDASTLSLPNFQKLYALQSGDSGGNYDLGVLIKHAQETITYSRQNNPQHFWGPFTGPIVSSAAFSFIPAFMSNHSAERPEGFLDQGVLKSFFAVSGTQGALSYQAGNERIPDNWYRRPIGVDYSIPVFSLDAVAIQLAVPDRVAVGGNTGTPNSFAGVDLGDLTGGVYNSATLLQGNNLVCFGYQTLLTAVPDILKGLLGDVTSALNIVTSKIAPQFAQFNCPQLSCQFFPSDFFTSGSALTELLFMNRLQQRLVR